ncbi:hypothetical protein CBL_01397 [Carabus blaptoides fortunei]
MFSLQSPGVSETSVMLADLTFCRPVDNKGDSSLPGYGPHCNCLRKSVTEQNSATRGFGVGNIPVTNWQGSISSLGSGYLWWTGYKSVPGLVEIQRVRDTVH